jgi:[acyl-carrier-protein] S-malonyltransferase
VAGHSLGELAALATAGVFSVEAGLELVVERSKLMSAAALSTPGAMVAVLGMDAGAVGAAIAGTEGVWIANDNAPGQIVLSGTGDGIESATQRVIAAGARKVVPLKVTGAFHSPLMEPARVAFEELLRGADFSDATVPVYQNTEPAAATDASVIRERLVSQIASPVRWTETMLALVSDGVTTLVEAGPGAVLTGLAKRVDGIVAMAAETAGIDSVLEEVG